MTAPDPGQTRVRRWAAAGAGLLAVAVLAFLVGRATSPDASTVPRTTTVESAAMSSPSAVDVGFSQDMSVHHEQAVLMAQLAQSRGGAAVRALATGILVDQSQELGMMRGWLRLWGRPAISPAPMAWMVGGMAAMPTTSTTKEPPLMPGMAAPRQLNTLWARSGKTFDVLFLQLMIRHHEGGIEMARDAAAHAHAPAVRAAAHAMLVEQVEDLARMRPLLEAYGGRQLPAP